MSKFLLATILRIGVINYYKRKQNEDVHCQIIRTDKLAMWSRLQDFKGGRF